MHDQTLADYCRLGALESGAKYALQGLTRQFMRGARCRLCCGTRVALELAQSLGRKHLAGCAIDDLERALAVDGHAFLDTPTPAAATDSAAGVVGHGHLQGVNR